MTALALGVAAIVAAALFTGAAAYIVIAEHPARRALPVRARLAHWSPSYARAVPMQAGLAAIAALAGLACWLTGGADHLWLAGSLLMAAVIAYTLIGIFPTNVRLKAATADTDDAEIAELLDRWGHLHAIRTVIGLLGLIAFVVALLR